jgi:lipopolysaccharide export system permease protein
MSYRRMMWPYFISAAVIALFLFYLANFVIPHSNLVRMDFEDKYYRTKSRKVNVENIHRMVTKNVYVYMESYSPLYLRGRNFTIEKFDDSGKLLSKLSSPTVVWDTTNNKWGALNYMIREIGPVQEIFSKGARIDTAITLNPSDFSKDPGFVNTMKYRELNDYIKLLRMQGSDELKIFLVEQHRRVANPFAVFILSLIGVTLSSRKVRGGIGMNIGIGLALSFSYILFQQFTSQFSLKGNLSPMLAMWIPNILYLAIGSVLYKMAPK